MFSSSLATLSFASILAILPPSQPNHADIASGSAITRYSSPAIAGLWELDTTPIIARTVSGAKNDADNNPNGGYDVAGIVSELTEQMSELSADQRLIVNETVTIKGISTIKGSSTINGTAQPNDNIVITKNAVTFDGAQCHEYYNFAANDTMWTVSGDEWTYGEYVVQPLSKDAGNLPLLVMKTLHDNNEPDCINNQVNQSGGVLAVYLDYRPDEQRMYWCKDIRGQECIMQFKRILP